VAKRELGDANLEVISPFHSAIRVEDYQLKPVLKSLLMPRVSLLLADDVGLGKTIEAGLILTELYARNRVQRVMVLCPASLQLQWQEELHDKFHLDFEIVDRNQSDKAKRLFGIDSNPWQIFPRIITSMDYLRQPDVIESFRACASRTAKAPHLPWQMLIVDEAHNLAPSVFNDDSDRCKMLRQITRYFEHKLFLSATPHNGYTVTFSGLLSILDPVRIQQASVLDEDDRAQIRLLMVRRLKSELNKGKHGPRFPHRAVESIPLALRNNPLEMKLYERLRRYRHALLGKTESLGGREKRVCDFVITLLTKRLLSSTYSFARTWWHYVEGIQLRGGAIDEAENAIRKAETEHSDDTVRLQREEDAAQQAGSWFSRYLEDFKKDIAEISSLLGKMGWTDKVVQAVVAVLKLVDNTIPGNKGSNNLSIH
jgi:SNF2 family DNA or RNA helicase